MIGLIDIGGTSIKFACQGEEGLVGLTSSKTPANLADFYEILTNQINKYKEEYQITGVGISSPGTVDAKTGIIGGASAIPYIHNFEIVKKLEELFELPVAIENDANCAALAEAATGAAEGKENVVFLVLGSGVGGAVIINGKIYHGSHLLGGEFGYMLEDEKHIFSNVGTITGTADAYNELVNPTDPISGEKLYDLATAGDQLATKYVSKMLFTLAKNIFNLQYSIDPDVFVIGGGISNNQHLLPDLNKQLDRVLADVQIAKVRPEIMIAKYKSEANLVGAAVNFEQKYGLK